MSDEKVRVVQMGYDGSFFTDDSLGAVMAELENAFDERVDAEYTIRFKVMSREKFDALPEFTGF